MTHQSSVLIFALPHCFALPSKATSGSAGYDIYAAIEHAISLMPGTSVKVPAGFKLQLNTQDKQFEAQIRPRSGLAAKHMITVLNSPGTIDADYTGEVEVILINHGREAFIIERGMRIAQMVIQEISRTNLVETKEEILPSSENLRGSGGFGSTGK